MSSTGTSTRSLAVSTLAVAFARLGESIDFGAWDAAPVRLVFLLVAPYGLTGALYFPLLSVVARAVQDESARNRSRLEDLGCEAEVSGRLPLDERLAAAFRGSRGPREER